MPMSSAQASGSSSRTPPSSWATSLPARLRRPGRPTPRRRCRCVSPMPSTRRRRPRRPTSGSSRARRWSRSSCPAASSRGRAPVVDGPWPLGRRDALVERVLHAAVVQRVGELQLRGVVEVVLIVPAVTPTNLAMSPDQRPRLRAAEACRLFPLRRDDRDMPSARRPAGVSAAATRWPTRPSAAAAMRPARTRWWAAVWSQQHRPSRNRSGSAPSKLRPARRDGAQDRSVASAQGARGGHGGLRGAMGLLLLIRSLCRPGSTSTLPRTPPRSRTGWAGNPAHPVRRQRSANDCSVRGGLRRADAGQRADLHLRVAGRVGLAPWTGPCRGSPSRNDSGIETMPGLSSGNSGSRRPGSSTP